VGQHDLLVRNDGDELLTLAITINPSPVVAPERSAAAWLAIPAASLEIAAGDGATLTVAITIPTGTPSGGYYARLSLTSDAEAAGANAAAIAGQLAVGFLITVEGEEPLERAAELGRFAPVLEGDGRIGFRAELVNTGNVHLIAPTGQVVVTTADGSAAGSLEFPETTPLLPGLKTGMTTQGSLPLTIGASYQAEASFTFLESSAPLTISSTVTLTPDLVVEPVRVCENLDRGPTLAVALSNRGQIGLLPYANLAVVSEADGSLGSAQVANGSLLWPRESQAVQIDFPERLESGSYTVTLTVRFDPLQPATVVTTPFQIGGLTGDPVPLCGEG
jgi:hypothetical protein